MRDVNIPPAGVMSGAPVEAEGFRVRDGDVLRLEARLHPAWLMAYRLTFLE